LQDSADNCLHLLRLIDGPNLGVDPDWVCNEGGAGDYVRAQLRYIEYFRWILDEWIPQATES